MAKHRMCGQLSQVYLFWQADHPALRWYLASSTYHESVNFDSGWTFTSLLKVTFWQGFNFMTLKEWWWPFCLEFFNLTAHSYKPNHTAQGAFGPGVCWVDFESNESGPVKSELMPCTHGSTKELFTTCLPSGEPHILSVCDTVLFKTVRPGRICWPLAQFIVQSGSWSHMYM